MTIVRAQSPFRWLRRLLLLLGVLTVLAIIVLLAAFQFGRTDRVIVADGSNAPDTNPDAVTAGQGFEYTQLSEGRRVFRLRADRSRQDRKDTAYLEEVVLDIFRQDGETYTITSNKAQVNQKSWAARLEGDVVISGWDDLVLEARELELLDGGQVLESVGAVEFRYPPDLIGRATQLLIDRRSDTFSLRDGVHLRNIPSAEVPIRLDCQRLIFRREEGIVRALDDVFLRFGPQELRSRFLTLVLGQGEGPGGIEALRARWDVSGTIRRTEGALGDIDRMDFSGSFFEMQPSDTHPDSRRIRLEGDRDRPATIQVVDGSGLARRLTGDILESQAFESGALQIVEGFGDPLILDEYLDFPEPFYLRQACGKRAVARFLPDGTVARIHFEEQVELRNEQLQLSGGDHANLNLEDGKLQIEGPAVHLYSERGDLLAPRFTYTRETGFIRAEGGVRASLQRSAMASLGDTPFGRGQGPIRVESEEAIFTDSPRTFSFRGGVRAWQAQNLILAEQLRGNESDRQLAASGPVKTIWVTSVGEGPDAVGSEPIEVTAQSLSFRQNENLLVYTDGVRVLQGSRSLQCQELTVELNPPDAGGPRPSAARRLTCHGGVEMQDPVANRRIWGDTAVYTLADERIEVFGEVVRLVDQQDNTLTGRYLVYDLRGGTVQLQSRDPRASGAGSG